MKRSLLLFFIFFTLYQTLFSQSVPLFSISGEINDSINKYTISYASVVAYQLPDSVIINGALSDENGKFKIGKLKPGEYLLKVNYMGYQTKMVKISIKNEPILLSNPILLEPNPNQLSGVEVSTSGKDQSYFVSGQNIYVKYSPESISGSLLDILKSYQEISIDESGTIYIRGNSNILVLYDGVPVNISFLQSTSANSVEKIEIITSPDVKYDAEGTAGIINIIPSKNKISGTSGEFFLNGAYPFQINGGVNLNFVKQKWTLSLQVYGQHYPENFESTISRTLYQSDIIANQKINNKKIQNLLQFNGLFQYKISNLERIIFSLNSSFPQNLQTQIIEGKEDTDTTSNSFVRKNQILFERKSFITTLTYEKNFKNKNHGISSILSFSRTKGNRPASYYLNDIFVQKSIGGGAPTNATIQFDYFNSFYNIDKVEFGIKWFYRWNNFNYLFYDWDQNQQIWIQNSIFSNDLQHQEHIGSIYLMASDSISRDIFCKLGVRLEYNRSELVQLTLEDTTTYQYLFPFPYLLIQYHLNKKNDFSFQYNRRITRPSYPQLNPYINIIDQLTYETGNKNLQPEVMDKVELGYSMFLKKFKMNLNLYSTLTHHFITQVSMITSQNQLAITYVNGDIQKRIGIDADFVFSPSSFINFQSGVSVFYNQTDGEFNEISLKTNQFGWKANGKISCVPWKKGEFQLLFVYNAPLKLPQFDLDKIYYFNFSFKQMVWKDKVSIQVSIVDLFNTQEWIIRSDNQIYKLENWSKGEPRKVWLGITYRFNSYKQTKTNKPTVNEEDSGIIKY